MRKVIIRSLAAVLLGMGVATAASAASGQTVYSFGVESRSFYSRWYEYPGIYYEEDFSLTGVRGEMLMPFQRTPEMHMDYGFSGAVYPIGSYVNSYGESNGALGLRASALFQIAVPMGSVDLLARGEAAYLVAIGDSDGGSHDDTFDVYLPSIDGGLGLKFNDIGLGSASSLTAMYTFTLVDLGISTDNWVSHTPSMEDWSNSSFVVMLNFGY